MEKQTLGSIDKILHRKCFSSLTKIYHQHQIALDAKKCLMNFNIDYFREIRVAFFNGKRLLLSTEIPELLSKFRELNDDLILLLKTHDYFSDLKTLKIKLHTTILKKRKKSSMLLSKKTCGLFQYLGARLENDHIKESISTLIGKYNG